MAKTGNDDSSDRLRGMQIAEQKCGFEQGLHVVFDDDLLGGHGCFPPEKYAFGKGVPSRFGHRQGTARRHDRNRRGRAEQASWPRNRKREAFGISFKIY